MAYDTNKNSPATRQSQDIFLLGQPSEYLDNRDKLPTKANVLRLLKFRQLKHKNKPLNQIIACKLESGTKNLICNEGECNVPEEYEWQKCVVSEIKSVWNKAGYSTVSDHSIIKAIINLNKDWQTVYKGKSKKGEGQRVREEMFKADVEELFDIAASTNEKGGRKTAEDIIMADKSRSFESKSEDIKFLKDQREEATMSLGMLDQDYSAKVSKKFERQAKTDSRIDKEKERMQNFESLENDCIIEHDENSHEMHSTDEDFHLTSTPPPLITKRSVPLACPKDILRRTALVAKRHKISPAAHSDIVAAVIGESGGGLDDISVSPGQF